LGGVHCQGASHRTVANPALPLSNSWENTKFSRGYFLVKQSLILIHVALASRFLGRVLNYPQCPLSFPSQ
jgi:hypothetical protein